MASSKRWACDERTSDERTREERLVNPAEFIQQLSASVAQSSALAVMVAAAGGALSTSACPCTVPTGLGLVSYVGGASGSMSRGVAGTLGDAGRVEVSARPPRPGLLSLLFFGGLVLSLTTLGVLAAVSGRVFTSNGPAFSVLAAVVLGLGAVAVLAGPWVRRRVRDPVVRQRSGRSGAFGYGAAYSVATITSSAGPLLLLLTVAAAVGRPLYGALLSFAFAIGRGLPFLALGYGAEHGSRRLGRWLERLDRGRRPWNCCPGSSCSA